VCIGIYDTMSDTRYDTQQLQKKTESDSKHSAESYTCDLQNHIRVTCKIFRTCLVRLTVATTPTKLSFGSHPRFGHYNFFSCRFVPRACRLVCGECGAAFGRHGSSEYGCGVANICRNQTARQTIHRNI
jgi:hypothetical protein